MRSLYDTSAVFSIICRSASAARENRSRGIKAMVTKRCAEEVSASLKLTRVYSLAFSVRDAGRRARFQARARQKRPHAPAITALALRNAEVPRRQVQTRVPQASVSYSPP